MIHFYSIRADYLDFLRRTESKVPNARYESHEKFYCGVVLSLGGISYYAPVSHFNQAQRTNFPILDHDGKTILSTIRLCFMIPAMTETVSKIDVKRIYESNPKYATLVSKEYAYCVNHEAALLKKAQSVYKIGCNKSHALNSFCCDFKKLESIYTSYQPA